MSGEKIPLKRRNKEQEVAFENTDVKCSGDSKKHTLTERCLLLLWRAVIEMLRLV